MIATAYIPVEVALIVLVLTLGLFCGVVLVLLGPKWLREVVTWARDLFAYQPPPPLSATVDRSIEALARSMYYAQRTYFGLSREPFDALLIGTRSYWRLTAREFLQEHAPQSTRELEPNYQERRRLDALMAITDRPRRIQ